MMYLLLGLLELLMLFVSLYVVEITIGVRLTVTIAYS